MNMMFNLFSYLGPYYKFSTWEGMYTDPWNPAVNGKNDGIIFSALHTRAKNVPYYVVTFLLSGYLFPMSVVTTEEWQETSSFLWKVLVFHVKASNKVTQFLTF